MPTQIFQINIDIPLAGLKLRDILYDKFSGILVLLLRSRILLRHLLDLLPQPLDLRRTLFQQALLLFDAFDIHIHLILRDLLRIKLPCLILRAIAVIDPVDKLKKRPQRCQRITWRYILIRMYRKISQPDDIQQLAPDSGIHRKAEGRFMQ